MAKTVDFNVGRRPKTGRFVPVRKTQKDKDRYVVETIKKPIKE